MIFNSFSLNNQGRVFVFERVFLENPRDEKQSINDIIATESMYGLFENQEMRSRASQRL
jgi:hypothetical protein